MGLNLKSGDIIFLDTAPFIYFFEQHQEYFPVLETFFAQLYKMNAQAITSIITYIELTTYPARQGEKQLVRKYRDYLSNSENISLFSLDMDIADHVVELRSKYHFKTLFNSVQQLPVVPIISSQMTRDGKALKG